MYSVSASNPFGGLPMDMKDMMEFGQSRFNPIMGVMSPAYVPFSQSTDEATRMLRRATNNVDVRANMSGNGPLKIESQYNPISVPKPGRLNKAIQICESIKNNECSAFNDPDFMENCVMSHDPNGFDSRGNAHQGGFVLFREDKEKQLERSRGGFPTFTATIGELPGAGTNYPQRVSYDKESCELVKKRIKCEIGTNYGDGCGTCYNTTNSYYIGDSQKQSTSLFIAGSGTYRMTYDGGAELTGASGALKPKEASEIRLPPDAEGKTFRLEVSSPSGEAYVGGYLQGMTRSGSNRTDLRFIAQNDSETKTKPLTAGSVEVMQNGTTERMSRIRTGYNKTKMSLSVYIPFTFIESTEPISFYCPNAPFNATKTSAAFLEKDPCYKRGPNGEISLACIQDRFTGVGCTSSASFSDGEATIKTGYPTTDAEADKYRKLNGNNLTLDEITTNMYNLYLKAKLGRDPATGAKFNDKDSEDNIKQWSVYSEQCLAKKLTTPCDQYDTKNGPLGEDCLEYLYKDMGRGNPSVGPTYDYVAPDYTSLKIRENMNSGFEGKYDPRQCTPSGTINPKPGSPGVELARQQGGVDNVKKFYNNIHKQANSTANNMTDNDRKIYMQQCYGINLVDDTRTDEGFMGRRY